MQPSGAVPDALRLGCQVSASGWAVPQWELLLLLLVLLLGVTWDTAGQRAK